MTNFRLMYELLEGGDVFEQEYIGFENLDDVMTTIDVLSDLTGSPPKPDLCKRWILSSEDGGEFAGRCI